MWLASLGWLDDNLVNWNRHLDRSFHMPSGFIYIVLLRFLIGPCVWHLGGWVQAYATPKDAEQLGFFWEKNIRLASWK